MFREMGVGIIKIKDNRRVWFSAQINLGHAGLNKKKVQDLLRPLIIKCTFCVCRRHIPIVSKDQFF